MLATTRGKSTIHFHQCHYCFIHNKYVDKNHLGECSLISKYGPADKFSITLKNFRLADLSVQKCQIVINYYRWLKQRINELVDDGSWKLTDTKSQEDSLKMNKENKRITDITQ